MKRENSTDGKVSKKQKGWLFDYLENLNCIELVYTTGIIWNWKFHRNKTTLQNFISCYKKPYIVIINSLDTLHVCQCFGYLCANFCVTVAGLPSRSKVTTNAKWFARRCLNKLCVTHQFRIFYFKNPTKRNEDLGQIMTNKPPSLFACVS